MPVTVLRHERFKIVQSRHRVDSVARSTALGELAALHNLAGRRCTAKQEHAEWYSFP